MGLGRGKGVSVEMREKVAVVRMDFGSANAIGRKFVQEFSGLIEELRTGEARGILLTGTGRHFSAGLDLFELPGLGRKDFEDFLLRLNRMLLALFTFPAPVVAAINGHAVAGGCLLALACDSRLMADDESLKIGLSEIDLGLPLPAAAIEICKHVLPHVTLRQVLYEGRLLTPRQAFEIGMVDEVVSPELLEKRALEMVQFVARKPVMAFRNLKRKVQADVVARIISLLGISSDEFVDVWYHEETQQLLTAAVERMRMKKG